MAGSGVRSTIVKRSETVSHKNETGWHDLVVFSPVTAWNRVFMSGTKRLAGVVEEDDRDGSTIEAGSTVLLLASCSEAPGREACRDLLTVSPTTRLNVLYVAFTNAGRNHLEWLTTEASLSPDRVTMIDAAPGPPRPPSVDHDGLVVDPVGSPGNLTKIGVAISEHCKEFEGGGTTVVCLRSLTALLQYIDLETAYRFLNAIANQLATVGAIGHCHLEPDAHSTKEINALRTLFDAAVDPDSPDGAVR